MSILKLLIVLCVIAWAKSLQHPVVVTSQGKIEGVSKKLKTKTQVDEFLGIPFAKPPVGSLRFAPPQPASPWNGTLKAYQKSKGCVQSASEVFKKTVWTASERPESEDCLYLNVWRPSQIKGGNRTVMIWIHGGAFMSGSGNMALYDGAILAAENNVIVVTFNYRLAMFGALYLDIPRAPGNAMLKDQILAFQWVYDNIAAFGGNRGNVVLFGQSAGGASVGFHLANLKVDHLYQRAILESGTSNGAVLSKSRTDALKISLELAAKVGCPSSPAGNRSKIVDCLNDVPQSQLISGFLDFPPSLAFYFVPVRNGIEVPEDIFTVAVPQRQRKNILLGATSSEETQFLPLFFPNLAINNNTVITEGEWSNVIEEFLYLTNEILIQIAMYPYKSNDGSYNPSQVRLEVAQYISDVFPTCPMTSYAEMYTSNSSQTYMYSFCRWLARNRVPIPAWAGSVHGNEIPFIFGAPLNPESGFANNDVKFSRQMMAYWTQFAKTGNPNGGRTVREFWPQYHQKDRKYITLNIKSGIESGLRGLQCQFWNTIYPDLLSIQAG